MAEPEDNFDDLDCSFNNLCLEVSILINRLFTIYAFVVVVRQFGIYI